VPFSRFLVASRLVRDLFVCAKHLFVAAMQMYSRAAPVGGCGALVGEHDAAKPGGNGMAGL
jgi:hypothetical protein